MINPGRLRRERWTGGVPGGKKESVSYDVDVGTSAGVLAVSSYIPRDRDVVGDLAHIPTNERLRRFEIIVKVGVVALTTIGTSERKDYV